MTSSAAIPINPGSSSRGRYDVLDVLRGIAAVVVVLFHSGQIIHGFTPRFGYLAVDLFFCISGFVLYKPYAKLKAAEVRPLEIFRWRATRLYPIYIVGVVLGTVGLIISGDQKGAHLIASIILNTLALPSPYPSRASGNYFPINDPFWSLFLEFWVANLIVTLFWRQLTRGIIICILIASAALLMVGLVLHKNLGGGFTIPTLYMGVARVLYSFFAGFLLAKSGLTAAPGRVSPALVVLVGIVFLFIPLYGVIGHICELMSVLLVFPALVYAGTTCCDTTLRWGRFLGDCSYALYAIHFPIIGILLFLLPHMSPLSFQSTTLALALALAQLVSYSDLRLRHALLTKSVKR